MAVNHLPFLVCSTMSEGSESLWLELVTHLYSMEWTKLKYVLGTQEDGYQVAPSYFFQYHAQIHANKGIVKLKSKSLLLSFTMGITLHVVPFPKQCYLQLDILIINNR